MKLTNINNLKMLGSTCTEVSRRISGGIMFSPICPDYHFRTISGKDKTERVHDFDGIGNGVGIVYEKLINGADSLLRGLEDNKISYQHLLLVADVESKDRVILRKLKISREQFVFRCSQTAIKINADLVKRGLSRSKCLLMSQYFELEKYHFNKVLESYAKRLSQSSDKGLVGLIRKVSGKRVSLYNYWFGLNEVEGNQRAIEDIAMYASFGNCPKINKGIILCADSEILSKCYNLFKIVKTPVLYISGKY